MLIAPFVMVEERWCEGGVFAGVGYRKPILKSISEDREEFINDGGWEFLNAEGGSDGEGDDGDHPLSSSPTTHGYSDWLVTSKLPQSYVIPAGHSRGWTGTLWVGDVDGVHSG